MLRIYGETEKLLAKEIHAACRHLIKEESYNCVNSCVSRSCYEEIYGKMPLEDGEIDLHREKAFSICVNNEFKRLKKVFA